MGVEYATMNVRRSSSLISCVLAVKLPFWTTPLRSSCWVAYFGLRLGWVCLAASVGHASSDRSIARDWDEQCLSAVRIDTPHPPAQARNLFSLSVCLYDAWAAYTNGPVGYVYRAKHTAPDVAAARREAISYAAYGLLRERYTYSRSASNTLVALA